MINFRFHIISLTAVFLAFAVGLVLGTTFLDDATERQLNRQLDDLDHDLSAARTTNGELREQLERFDEEGPGLDLQVGERVLRDSLAGEAVLVVAPEDLDGEPVERVVEALQVSGADFLGAWRLTDRLTLDDDDEVGDLATALDIPDDEDVERLRAGLSAKLATALFLATHSSGADEDTANVAGITPPAAEPASVAALHEEGFIDYELPEGSEDDVVELPSSGLRVVVVTGTGTAVPNDQVLLPTLADLVSDGAAPVVVTALTPTEEDDPNNVDGVDSLVAAVRDEDELSERISTVDDLETVSGRMAVILALQQVEPSNQAIGHYGLGPGAEELMPPVPEGEGDQP